MVRTAHQQSPIAVTVNVRPADGVQHPATRRNHPLHTSASRPKHRAPRVSYGILRKPDTRHHQPRSSSPTGIPQSSRMGLGAVQDANGRGAIIPQEYDIENIPVPGG
mmetsp:Transcript_44070/g.52914  ORF Transcript_44070/g.52914 Transcript_44070/m.52914 type:complete len:107 (+) Transcript_44070:167-487(+)